MAAVTGELDPKQQLRLYNSYILADLVALAEAKRVKCAASITGTDFSTATALLTKSALSLVIQVRSRQGSKRSAPARDTARDWPHCCMSRLTI